MTFCRYDDCANALQDQSNVCPHEAEESCTCNITCPLCRASLGLENEDEREREREAAHERGMEKWARAYDELNGAPEGPEDR